MMKQWTITFGGQTWTDEAATVMHVVAVAELTDGSWAAMSPWNGPRQLAAWLSVLLSTQIGDLDAATAIVYAMSPAELAEVLAERDDVAVVSEPAAMTSK
jgi:N-acyl-D-aspartate/D-glutamate deacylase